MSQHASLTIDSLLDLHTSLRSGPTAFARAFGFTKRMSKTLGRRKAERKPPEQAASEHAVQVIVTAPLPQRHYEIIDGVDERLLPWSCD